MYIDIYIYALDFRFQNAIATGQLRMKRKKSIRRPNVFLESDITTASDENEVHTVAVKRKKVLMKK